MSDAKKSELEGITTALMAFTQAKDLFPPHTIGLMTLAFRSSFDGTYEVYLLCDVAETHWAGAESFDDPRDVTQAFDRLGARFASHTASVLAGGDAVNAGQPS